MDTNVTIDGYTITPEDVTKWTTQWTKDDMKQAFAANDLTFKVWAAKYTNSPAEVGLGDNGTGTSPEYIAFCKDYKDASSEYNEEIDTSGNTEQVADTDEADNIENNANVAAKAKAEAEAKAKAAAATTGAGHNAAVLANNGIIDFASFAQSLAFSKAAQNGLNRQAQCTIHEYLTNFMSKFYHQLYYIPNLQNDMAIVVKPETLFIYAPSCNVIYPNMKSSINYSRPYKTEPTRLIQVTNPTLSGDSAATRNSAATTLTCLSVVTQSDEPTIVSGMPKYTYSIASFAAKDATGKANIACKSDYMLLDLTPYENLNGIRMTMNDKGADLWLYMVKGTYKDGSTGVAYNGGNVGIKDGVMHYKDVFTKQAQLHNIDANILLAISAHECGNPDSYEEARTKQQPDGYGRGIMQIDIGQHPEFTQWDQVEPSVSYAASLYSSYRQQNIDRGVAAADLTDATIISYNQGPGGAWYDAYKANPNSDWRHAGGATYLDKVKPFLVGGTAGASNPTNTTANTNTSTTTSGNNGTLSIEAGKKSGAGYTLARLSRYELARQRFSPRAGSCETYFNPYIVPGFPFISLEPNGVDEGYGLTIFGYVTSVTHNLSDRQWTTQVSYTAARMENEDTPRSYPIVESEYTTNIADTYRDMLGEHIKSVSNDSVATMTSSYNAGKKTLSESLARCWRACTPITEHLTDICEGATLNTGGKYWYFEGGFFENDENETRKSNLALVRARLKEYTAAIYEKQAMTNDDVR